MATTTSGGRTFRAARARGCALVAILALVGCRGGRSQPPRSATGIAISPSPAYVAVGAQQQFKASVRYSDGTDGDLTASVSWSSSDASVAVFRDGGLATVVGPGPATVTATDPATGLSARADLVSRAITVVGAASLPRADSVGAATASFRIAGLSPGAFYAVSLGGLTDDLDLGVFGDASFAAPAQLCTSEAVGTAPEACVAPANAAGELYVAVDGSWSEAGSPFALGAAAAAPAPATALASSALPFQGSVAAGTTVAFKVTGLTPGASYAVRLSSLSDDVDLEVYGDPYLFATLCASYRSGTADESCVAKASPAGELYVEADGESTTAGGTFTLTVN